MRIALLLVVVGCWQNGPGAETPEPEPGARQKGATCEEVSNNTRKVLAVATDKELASRADPIGIIVLRRCFDDEWSTELRRCITGAKTDSELHECEKLATPQQKQKFQHELEMFAVSEDGQ